MNVAVHINRLLSVRKTNEKPVCPALAKADLIGPVSFAAAFIEPNRPHGSELAKFSFGPMLKDVNIMDYIYYLFR